MNSDLNKKALITIICILIIALLAILSFAVKADAVKLEISKIPMGEVVETVKVESNSYSKVTEINGTQTSSTSKETTLATTMSTTVPTSTPTTAQTTVPTTMPTSTPTTAQTTVPTTAPISAPTTAQTTAPTTVASTAQLSGSSSSEWSSAFMGEVADAAGMKRFGDTTIFYNSQNENNLVTADFVIGTGVDQWEYLSVKLLAWYEKIPEKASIAFGMILGSDGDKLCDIVEGITNNDKSNLDKPIILGGHKVVIHLFEEFSQLEINIAK